MRSYSAAINRWVARSLWTETAVAMAVAAEVAKASSMRWSSRAEVGPILESIERDQHAVALAAEQHRHNQAGLGCETQATRTLLLEACAVHVVLEPQRLALVQRQTGDAALRLQGLADNLGRQAAGGRGHNHLAFDLPLDHERLSGNELPASLGHQFEHDIEVRLTAHGASDQHGRVECGHRALQLRPLRFDQRIAMRVIDRDPGELREHDECLLVIHCERLLAGLVGEVDVPERLARNKKRHAQKGCHRRVTGGKP